MYIFEIIRLGLNDLRLHLLRSVLTALGIILGVAAVITMVSIGEGSKLEALATIERLGARNTILRSQKPPESSQQQGGQQSGWLTRFGITRDDMAVIEANFPDATWIVPVKAVGGEILRENRRQVSQAFGTTPEFPLVSSVRVERGRYLTNADMENRSAVLVIGSEVAKEMFPFDDPIGQTLRIDEQALEIVGVLAPVGLSGGSGAALIGRDLNLDVHMPITTALAMFGDLIARRAAGSFEASEVEISEIYLTSPDRERVLVDAQRLRRLMAIRSAGMSDLGVIVPYELLDKARRDALTWNLVLGAIAGISLLVGGIGIMNIMLATVTERTREIGIRRALGATRGNITAQFLVETGVLSALGGLIGVALGIGLSVAIEFTVPLLPDAPLVGRFFDRDAALPTAITTWSIALSFGVATLIGLVFGIYPAMQAAKQDPIVALRHD
ncbi:MAG: FtsX-like permease family protein [Phycisphaerales bacterium]|nr:MAG: FtsX-like permease family protein [Phycisphaerales bacterium]